MFQSTADEGLQGLIVMLHGCTQSPEDFAAGTGMNLLAEEHRLLIVYAAQTGGDNSMSCWNWFRPGDQMRDIRKPAIIAGLTASLRDQYAIPKDRVFVAGLSAGGAMAAMIDGGETYPGLYGAIGVHSGLAYGSANDVMSAFTAMRGQAGMEQGALDERRRRLGSRAEADRVSRRRRHHGPPFECRADHCEPGWSARRKTFRRPSTVRRVRPEGIRASSRSGTTARMGSSAG